jgi:hypothetical protein
VTNATYRRYRDERHRVLVGSSRSGTQKGNYGGIMGTRQIHSHFKLTIVPVVFAIALVSEASAEIAYVIRGDLGWKQLRRHYDHPRA